MEGTSRIKQLPEEVISRIAAGEVVENPASVLRELLENSIDAGATRIDITVEEGGKKLIKVVDDGHGMNDREIELAVRRFTTSKISSVDDLESIGTLGFRGEALYAIGSVSRLTIRSKRADEDIGYEGYFEEAELVELKPAPIGAGTTVTVRDLFYNFPVRRKFLGSDYAEARRIIEVVTDYALAHPGISFSLRIDGKDIMNLGQASSPIERIEQIYGQDFIEETITLTSKFGEKLTIHGVISRPDRVKKSPLTQLLFVNGRRIRDNRLRAAIYGAYEQEKMHPQYILFIEVDPRFVDFNIHPQKKEVKFHRTLRMYEKLMKSVRETLNRSRTTYSHLGEMPTMRIVETPITHVGETGGRQMEIGEMQPRLQAEERREEIRDESTYIPEKIWQIHDSYIIAQVRSGFIIVDQHAAHERILYEKLRKRKYNTQNFLFPIVLNLTPKEFAVFQDISGILEGYGFRIKILSGRTAVVEGAPDIFKNPTKEIFLEIIDELQDVKSLPDRHLELLKTLACKAAIKAGDKLSGEEMNALLDQLFSCENPFFCPHGRPTVIKISLEELERKFARNL